MKKLLSMVTGVLAAAVFIHVKAEAAATASCNLSVPVVSYSNGVPVGWQHPGLVSNQIESLAQKPSKSVLITSTTSVTGQSLGVYFEVLRVAGRPTYYFCEGFTGLQSNYCPANTVDNVLEVAGNPNDPSNPPHCQVIQNATASRAAWKHLASLTQ